MITEKRDTPIDRAFRVIQVAVILGRKLKTGARVSFKERPFLLHVFIPLNAFALLFSMEREDNERIIKFLLRASEIYIEEEGFDTPYFLLSDWERYSHYAGTEVDEGTGIKATLWTQSAIWD